MTVDLSVDAPMVLKVRPTGDIELHYFQGLMGSSEAVLMRLIFSPSASGQLVMGIKALLETGAIVLETSPGYHVQ
ncbi:hypothetical protein [Denitromonas iodatirespirans]|uniref:Uncharacterized protein n=1 Tax=Denitromonas iodatirespirans TaxID=2795389 RepID=A0A944HES6_DENI1|nr:hypothetical protein [Denitromonas iodatirespirans]MBT0963131.1 hypothetical protein [Denitromonas iodatirespirans]